MKSGNHENDDLTAPREAPTAPDGSGVPAWPRASPRPGRPQPEVGCRTATAAMTAVRRVRPAWSLIRHRLSPDGPPGGDQYPAEDHAGLWTSHRSPRPLRGSQGPCVGPDSRGRRQRRVVPSARFPSRCLSVTLGHLSRHGEMAPGSRRSAGQQACLAGAGIPEASDPARCHAPFAGSQLRRPGTTSARLAAPAFNDS
jgi:hypothetical protein